MRKTLRSRTIPVPVAAALSALMLAGGCSLPILYPDLSYAAAFYNKLELEASFEISETPEYETHQDSPAITTFTPNRSGSDQLFVAIPENNDQIILVQADGANPSLQRRGRGLSAPGLPLSGIRKPDITGIRSHAGGHQLVLQRHSGSR
jgi:hypothetical protein